MVNVEPEGEREESTETDLFKSRIIWLWKSDDLRRLKDGREKSLSLGRSGWWLVGMWSCGFLRATLMSFSSRGRGPSLRMASCSTGTKEEKRKNTTSKKVEDYPTSLSPTCRDLRLLLRVNGLSLAIRFSISNSIYETLSLWLFCSPVLNVCTK